MAEVTKLQALGAWLWKEPIVKLVGALVFALAATLLWLNSDTRTPIGADANGGLASSDKDIRSARPETSDVSEQNPDVSVGGDGVAAGRDVNIEGPVNFR